jgi:proteasome maturation protein
MELKIVQAGDWRPSALGRPSGVHEDILSGRDTEIDWEDVYTREERVVGGEETGGGVHGEMERMVGMGKW